MKVGLDIGSGNLKTAVLSDNGSAKFSHASLERRPVQKVREFFESLEDGEYDVAVTGMNSPAIADILGLERVLEAVAVIRGAQMLHPEANTIFDIGQERASFYGLKTSEGGSEFDIPPVSPCGAGGGALIEKMARRLAYPSLDAFVEAAMKAERPAHMAGRCAVFAESDVVHEANKGRLTGEIAAGLCQMFARNFKTNVISDREVVSPVILLGGVGKNAAFVKFLEQQTGQKIVVPEDFLDVKAYGAALCAKDQMSRQEVLERLSAPRKTYVSFSQPLKLLSPTMEKLPYEVIGNSGGNKILLSISPDYKFDTSRVTPVYLGLDVGSVSTKTAIIDQNGQLMLGVYQRTSGKPIEAVKSVIEKLGSLEIQGRKLKDIVDVLEAGVTGSGRAVAGKIIGDHGIVVKNEITAQARGATYFFPDADTIFEIGGQDSKYISLRDGRVVDCEMNKSCAASTGSFLEEQASVLGINIEKEFASRALASQNPVGLAEKCAVFMTSSLLSHYDSPVEDKCAGLAKAIAQNYLNRVAKRNGIGNRVVFQGAVAFNQAVVAGFETVLGKRVYVPQYPHLTGAIGMASITKDIYEARK